MALGDKVMIDKYNSLKSRVTSGQSLSDSEMEEFSLLGEMDKDGPQPAAPQEQVTISPEEKAAFDKWKLEQSRPKGEANNPAAGYGNLLGALNFSGATPALAGVGSALSGVARGEFSPDELSANYAKGRDPAKEAARVASKDNAGVQIDNPHYNPAIGALNLASRKLDIDPFATGAETVATIPLGGIETVGGRIAAMSGVGGLISGAKSQGDIIHPQPGHGTGEVVKDSLIGAGASALGAGIGEGIGAGIGAGIRKLTPGRETAQEAAQKAIDQEMKAATKALDFLDARAEDKTAILSDPDKMAKFLEEFKDLKPEYLDRYQTLRAKGNKNAGEAKANLIQSSEELSTGRTVDPLEEKAAIEDRLSGIEGKPFVNQARAQPLRSIADQIERPVTPPQPKFVTTGPDGPQFYTPPPPPNEPAPLSDMVQTVRDVASGNWQPGSKNGAYPNARLEYQGTQGEAEALDHLSERIGRAAEAQGATPEQVQAYKTLVQENKSARQMAELLNGESQMQDKGVPWFSKAGMLTAAAKHADVLRPASIKWSMNSSESALKAVENILAKNGKLPAGTTIDSVNALRQQMMHINTLPPEDRAVYQHMLASTNPAYMAIMREKADDNERH